MKVIFASDSFKNSCSSSQINSALAGGFREINPDGEFISVAVSDGGEGLLEALVNKNSECVEIEVSDPLGRPVKASYLINGDSAVIEMAEASGLQLLKPAEYNPLLASTVGTGQLIKDAIDRGCRKLLIGIGGSATCDMGIGAASVFGYKFLDKNGNPVKPCGGEMANIVSIDSSAVLTLPENLEVYVACDVDNPLYGSNGASYVYSPQKGADESAVKFLDDGLRNMASVVQLSLGISLDCCSGNENSAGDGSGRCAGYGAAGGLGAGLVAFFGGKLQRGIDSVLDSAGFDSLIDGADLVVTGEGSFDLQSAMGKVISGISQRCSRKGVPVVVFTGNSRLEYREYNRHGILAVFALADGPMSLEESVDNVLQLAGKSAAAAASVINFFIKK